MPEIFIDGWQGTTGLKIVQRLKERDDLKVVVLEGEERKSLFSRRSRSGKRKDHRRVHRAQNRSRMGVRYAGIGGGIQGKNSCCKACGKSRLSRLRRDCDIVSSD